MASAMGRAWSLRPDIQVLPAESEDGSPALLVYDPVPETYDRVEWPESDLVHLLRSPLDIDELLRRFRSASTLRPTREEVAAYVAELGRRGWLRGSAFWPQDYRAPARPGWVRRVAGLFFIQCRLVKLERFLAATVGTVRAIFNPATRALLLAVFLAGVYLTMQRWEEYWQDSLGSVNWGSLPYFLLALIAVKTVHEFSHAYQATASGARVPAMGIALFFGMPLPFTDVTDAWRLAWPERRAVVAAGLKAEIALAGVALFLWALSPPGAAATALARLSSVALASTILTNLNPGPRFDGYYLLVTLLRVENLRGRGAMLLWGALGRRVFGFAPRGVPDIRRHRGAILAFSAYSFVYRLALGCGLVAMVYHLLPKALGLPAAALAAWMFFGAPLFRYCAALWRERGAMRPTLPGIILVAVLAGLTLWAFGSWPRRLAFPGVTRSRLEEAVRVRAEGMLAEIAASPGQRVGPGEVLARLEAPWEPGQLEYAEWRLREAELAEERSWRAETGRRESGWRGAETARRRAELESVRHGGEDLAVVSPAGGTLSHWDRALEVGTPLPRGRLLGWVTDGAADMLVGYVPVAMADRFAAGAEVWFYADSGDDAVRGEVVLIEPSRPELLDHPQLAAQLGAVAGGDGTMVLPGPYARVNVLMDRSAARIGQTGRIWVWTKPESLAARAWDWLHALALRESAF